MGRDMHFRLKLFALHLSSSAIVLTLILGSLYLGWYRWPGWYLTDVTTVVLVMVCVDVMLGPTLTLIIANQKKSRRVVYARHRHHRGRTALRAHVWIGVAVERAAAVLRVL